MTANVGAHQPAHTIVDCRMGDQSGSLLLSWPQLGKVEAGSAKVTFDRQSGCSVVLMPSVGTGEYYTAVYHLDDGTVQKEFWDVPARPKVTRDDVVRR